MCSQRTVALNFVKHKTSPRPKLCQTNKTSSASSRIYNKEIRESWRRKCGQVCNSLCVWQGLTFLGWRDGEEGEEDQSLPLSKQSVFAADPEEPRRTFTGCFSNVISQLSCFSPLFTHLDIRCSSSCFLCNMAFILHTRGSGPVSLSINIQQKRS